MLYQMEVHCTAYFQVFFSKPTAHPEATLTSIQKQYTQDPYR